MLLNKGEVICGDERFPLGSKLDVGCQPQIHDT